MIAEAIDTLVTLGWALAAWITLLALTVTLAVYAVAVVTVGACVAVRRGAAGACSALRPLAAPEPHPHHEQAAHSRTRPHDYGETA